MYLQLMAEGGKLGIKASLVVSFVQYMLDVLDLPEHVSEEHKTNAFANAVDRFVINGILGGLIGTFGFPLLMALSSIRKKIKK